jgi:Leucine-rich repeat (LRR) protein
LQALDLGGTQVTDAGLKELKALQRLQTLVLTNTRVTAAGLKELKGLKGLQTLDLGDSKVTDAALRALGEIGLLHALPQATAERARRPGDPAEVTRLDLRCTGVTDAGLRELKRFESLEKLYLAFTRVTDAGLKELKGLKSLDTLYLHPTQVTDGALRALGEIGLVHALARATAGSGQRPAEPADVLALDLRGTPVTDAGLKELKGLPNLQTLDLRDTRVTAAGVNALQASRPALSCKTSIQP